MFIYFEKEAKSFAEEMDQQIIFKKFKFGNSMIRDNIDILRFSGACAIKMIDTVTKLAADVTATKSETTE